MIELLAPAKNKICAKAAIDCGADAIYIGADEFGARKNAPNSIEDIKEIVEYAHKFNVRVYVTINTILTDDETTKAKELIKKLNRIKVDAIIVQDLGLIALAKSVPNTINYHASTQCDNRTPEKVKFLESVGFSRIVLARELSIEKIQEIKNQTKIELETFIHGALCVSYSGQCYLSHLIGGRSANRGECAQPCRKKYSLVDEDDNFIAKDKHLLNLKDFNASKHIKALAEIGVTSFKIEGRLKDENYVKNVVAYYRKLIDDLGFKKTSSGEILLDFEPNLDKSFNRGFTNYFLEEREACYEFSSPKSRGEYLGKVAKIWGNSFEIKPSAKSIAPQDGLCFYVNDELSGCLVNKTDNQKIYPNKMDGIKIGTEIYRNFDSEFEKQLKNSKTSRKILANIEFELDRIKIKDEDGNYAEIAYNFEEIAQNEQKMSLNIINQLKKSGESDFLIKDVHLKLKKTPFLHISKLNALRRNLLEQLIIERLKNYSSPNFSPLKNGIKYPQAEIDYKGNILNKYAKTFYEDHGCKVLEPALENTQLSSMQKTNKLAMTTKHCLKYAFNMCKSPKTLSLIDEKGKRYNLKFNCDKCEMEIYF